MLDPQYDGKIVKHRLGKIQQAIVNYLKEYPDDFQFIGMTMRSEHLSGLYWEDVEVSLNKLLHRGIVIKKGFLYKLK